MRIMVRTLRGDRVALDVDGATTTVAEVKSAVMARESVPVEMQRLFFAGRLLDDDDTPVAGYGVREGSVVFLSLRLRDEETRDVQQMQREPATAEKQELQLQPVHAAVNSGGEEEEVVVKRKTVSRRSIRKILSRLHVDVWTSQHDARFLDLLLRHTNGVGRGVDGLTARDWASIGSELNAATGSAFAVEELQRRLGELRREFDVVSRIRSHPGFTYDARRRVVVAAEADWKRYVLENPEAAAYEGTTRRRSTRLGRLRAIFAGSTGDGTDTRVHGGGGTTKCREWRAKRCLRKLLRSFGLQCEF